MSKLLIVEGLTVKNGNCYLVNQLKFELSYGQVLSVVGQSGSGKSLAMLSLLAMNGALSVRGQVKFSGQDLPIDEPNNKQWQSIRGRQIGYIFQDPKRTLNPLHTVVRAFSYLLKQAGIHKKYHKIKTLELLTQVQLPNAQSFLTRLPHQLSAGEAQRIAIAMVLALEPQLIIADEPTSSLDEALKADILALLKSLVYNKPRALIVISHDVMYLPAISDRYLCMYQGRQVAFGQELPASVLASLNDFGTPNANDDNALPLLSIQSLTLAYQKNWFGRSAPIIDGLNLTILQGQMVGLMGRSGRGKSSLAKAITRLDNRLHIQGQIDFFDEQLGKQSITILNEQQLAGYRPKVIWMIQEVASSLNPHLHIITSLMEGTPTLAKEELASWLAMVALPEALLSCYPHQLSGGELMRVCLLRALLAKPKLLILDEPTAMLDGQSTKQVVELLRQINKKSHLAMLIISHEEPVLQALCQTIVRI